MDKHCLKDDILFDGCPDMVMKPEAIFATIEPISSKHSRALFM
jgi:tRNA G37 N-methylase TrmD